MAAKTKTLGTSLGFLGLALVVGTVMVWFRQNTLVDLPENRTGFVIFWLSGAALGLSAFVTGTRWFGGIAAVLAIFVGCFFPFTVSISRQEIAPNGIQVGQVIPQFVALDQNGKEWDSAKLQGKPVLMKFFRGHW